MSSLTWLENNLWLSIHTTTNVSPPSSVYHIITRQSPTSFSFQKMTDPVDPFGSEKSPHHSILRLRDFPPDLQDLLIVASTASAEVGLLSRSKSPLATDKPADLITGVFTTTEIVDDTKRPTLPMTDSMDDSVPIGIALDLSSKDRVYKPIPSDDELEESPSPLPGFWLLTHEGVLCSWWLVYTDSIKKGTSYPGLAAGQASAFGSTSQTAPAVSSPFSAAGASPFASSSAAAPAFASSSQLGQKSSPWGAAAATSTPQKPAGAVFGSSTFGNSSSTPNSAFGQPSSVGFGQSSQLGMRSSPWASGGTPAAALGQSGFASFASKGAQSPFANAAPSSTPTDAPASGGFAGFASKGGFASLGGDNNNSSIFGSGSKPSGSIFGAVNGTSTASAFPPKPSTSTGSIFGSGSSFGSAFPPKDEKSPGSVFGSTAFKLESSFKPDPSAKEDNSKPAPSSSTSMFGSAFGSALSDTTNKPNVSTPAVKDQDMDAAYDSAQQTPQAQPKSFFASQASPESTTPTTTPAPSKFGALTSPAPGSSLFGPPTTLGGSSGGLFGSKQETPKPNSGFGLFGQPQSTTPNTADDKKSGQETPKVKVEEDEDAPLPPESTSKASYPLGDSSASSAASTAPSQSFGFTTTPSKPEATLPSSGFGGMFPSKAVEAAPLPPDYLKPGKQTDASNSSGYVKVSKPADISCLIDDAPLPPDYLKGSKTAPKSSILDIPLPADSAKGNPFLKPSNASMPSGFILPKASSRGRSHIPSVPDSVTDEDSDVVSEDESDLEHDNASEGSGVDVAKDLSPSTSGLAPTPGYTPQSSFGGIGGVAPTAHRPEQEQSRPLFGEISRNAPLFARPTATTSPRSPSPIRGAIPNRVIRSEATRSVSAPGMASQILGPQRPQSNLGQSAINRERLAQAEDSFIVQHRKLKERQEAAETQPLVDEEDDEVQKVLASQIVGNLGLDEFIAYSNVGPPAKESIASQVEAVYRDINSMIDTLGLNARAVKSFTKGHTEQRNQEGRSKHDLEDPDDWVLCEVSDLGDILDNELQSDLDDGRVQDLDDKLDACQDLSRDMQRLRAKQEDLKRVIMARMDPGQADLARSLPLSAEQAAQQNELRREMVNFTKLLTEAEEALTLLKTRLASVSSSTGKGNTNVPTVEAVMRTITKMTTMVEKRSGDVDVLETHLRKMRFETTSREGSPMVTPQARRSIMMSVDSTPSRNIRHSLSSSVMSLGPQMKATPPRKKLSGFSKEEKGDLMGKRARRQAVLDKLKESVQRKGVNVWNMEDIE